MDIDKKIADLRNFYREYGRMPGYAEMLELFEYRSKNAVYKLLSRLQEMEIIYKEANGKIVPGAKLTGSVRLLGSVKAGFPSPAEEEAEVEMINLDEFLVSRPDSTFMLKVSGDSMVDAGIYEGDMVLVERQDTARTGDVVVGQVDGEWTLKYFRRKGRKIILEPANDRYKPLVPQHDFTLGGVVKAVIRRYR
jgi:repressor LexA